MSAFIDKYVRAPIERVLQAEPEDQQSLPELRLKMEPTVYEAQVSGSTLRIARAPDAAAVEDAEGSDAEEEELTLEP